MKLLDPRVEVSKYIYTTKYIYALFKKHIHSATTQRVGEFY